jgi:peptidoglycan/LPS O-acetylase OafA/YrhL
MMLWCCGVALALLHVVWCGVRFPTGVYLTHIMIIRMLYYSVQKQFDYDDYTGAWIFTANYCLALLSSFGVYTLVEKPFANLTMMLLAPPRKKQ